MFAMEGVATADVELRSMELEMIKLKQNHKGQIAVLEKEVEVQRLACQEAQRSHMESRMSLEVFNEWTTELQKVVDTQLTELSQANIALKTENQILLRRLAPLLGAGAAISSAT